MQHQIKVSFADNFKDKSIGLIGAGKIRPLYMKTRFGLHTFLMKKPIDVVILDSDGVAVILKESLQPNKLFFWNPCYFRVIELPAGTISRKRIRKGDEITIS